MHPSSALRISRRIGVSLVAALGLAVFASPAAAAPQIIPASTPGNVVCTNGPTFNLTADDGRIQTPDGNSLYMWGYAPTGGTFQIPGPVLCVTEGALVTVNLTNNLAEPTSIVFPGQSGVTTDDPTPGYLAGEADPGGTVSYSFTASRPGTYLYESGTEPSKQVEMGLYGAIIVRPLLGPTFAYNDPATAFDPTREYILVLHDIDPDLHHAVEHGQAFDITTKHDRYWTINGRSFPDSIADSGAPWLPAQPYGSLVWVERRSPLDDSPPALIRYANAGLSNHPFHPHGNHLSVIARDGAVLKGSLGQDRSMEAFTKTIGSGQTYDLLFRFDDDEGYSPTSPVQFEGQDVVFPGLLNTVFKDDLTFYGGSPYLGEQDELPPRVTTLNECGEFYFPWHSHALHEFQNFDEGFGGLATLLRVDPPGGCIPPAAPVAATPRPRVALPAARAAVKVGVTAKVRGRTLTLTGRTVRCKPCVVTAKVKPQGHRLRSVKMRKVGARYVAVVRGLPRGRVNYHAVARDLDSGRTARSTVQVARIGPAAAVLVNLCADEGTTTLLSGADAVTVPIWGFSENTGLGCPAAQLPGPELEAVAGDIVTVNLTNNLSENVSLVIPGQTFTVDAGEIAPGGTGTYVFTAVPGAYLYQSGVNPFRQNLMGMYGALVVASGVPGQAYPLDPATAFDVEEVMVLSELDVEFNNGSVAPGDYDPEYWLINGQPYDPANPAASDISAAPGQRVLLRYLNAGQEHHTMTLLGMRQRIIARDSFHPNPLLQPLTTPDVMAETIATGSSADAIATVPGSGRFPLYSRQLAVTNGPAYPGGMLTFIAVP